MPIPFAVISALASAAASAYAAKKSGDSRTKAAKKAQGYVNGIEVPSLEEARAQLIELVQQGVITPEQAQAIEQEQTAFSQIDEDPRLRQTQVDALTQLEEIANAGGMDARLRASLYDIGAEQAAQNRGDQEAILANARARGIGGSNLETVNRLVASQAAATRGANQGVQAAALAESRRMQALQDAASLGGSIRSADYQKSAQEAAARDAIARFNTQARQNAANQNVAMANSAQAANLGEKQRIADVNAGAKNDVQSKLWDLQFRKGTAQANAALGVGAGQAADSQAKWQAAQGGAQAGGTFANTLSSVFGGAGQQQTAQPQQDYGYGPQQPSYMMSDERAKTDIEPFDAEALLEDLSGVKYRYKPGLGQPEGKQVGVMAQDIERHAPGAVETGKDGLKRVNNDQLGGILLATLADMHDRVSNLEGKRNG